MSARVDILDEVLEAVDGDRRAQQALRSIEQGVAACPDHLLHELLDVLMNEGTFFHASPRLRGFMRAIAKRLENVR